MSKKSSASHQSNVLGYLVWAIVSILYGYQYIIRVFPAFAMKELMQKFSLSPEQFGYFAGIYYIGYSVGHIPLGILLDRIDTKRVMLICCAIVGCGLIPIVFSNQWTIVVAGRFMVGFGSSGFILGAMKVIKMAFGIGFGKMLGFMVTIGLVLTSISSRPIIAVLASSGLDYLLGTFLVATVLLGVAVFIFMPNHKRLAAAYPASADEEPEEDAAAPAHQQRGALADVKSVLLNVRVVSMAIIGGLMLGVLEGFGDAWVTPFLETIYRLPTEQAVLGSSAIFIGLCIGFPLLGYVSEIAGNRITQTSIALACAGLMLGLFLMLMFQVVDLQVDLNGFQFNMVHVVLLLLGILCGYQITILNDVAFHVPNRLFAMSAAITNMIMMGFGSFFHTAISNVVAIYNVGNPQGVYSAEALLAGSMPIPITLVLAVIWLALISFASSYRKKRKSRNT